MNNVVKTSDRIYVIRCKDCAHYLDGKCLEWQAETGAYGFCHAAIRDEEGEYD